MAGDDLQDLTQQMNNTLGGLNDVLVQICSQLERHHSNDEFARLYVEGNRRYLRSKQKCSGMIFEMLVVFLRSPGAPPGEAVFQEQTVAQVALLYLVAECLLAVGVWLAV